MQSMLGPRQLRQGIHTEPIRRPEVILLRALLQKVPEWHPHIQPPQIRPHMHSNPVLEGSPVCVAPVQLGPDLLVPAHAHTRLVLVLVPGRDLPVHVVGVDKPFVCVQVVQSVVESQHLPSDHAVVGVELDYDVLGLAVVAAGVVSVA